MACLKYMIAEIRSKKRFKRRVKLLDGHLIDLHQNTYRFGLDEEDGFLEGSKGELFIGAEKRDAYIVSVSATTPRLLLLSLDKNMGDVIEECELLQDDGFFYEALLARYEVETGEKKHTSLKKVEADFSFADRVLANQYQEITDVISVNTGDLNSYQHSFLPKAAGHDISFLWGPPGTGKTKCLGALVAAFYQAGEKSAIVSNTNKRWIRFFSN